MNAIDFPESNMILAKDQPQYNQLPIFLDKGKPEGVMVSCWHMSIRERLILLFTGRLWVSVMTFHNPLQPLLFGTKKSDIFETYKVKQEVKDEN